MQIQNVIINSAGDEQGFKDLRRTHIGSSDISTIVGLNRFSTKYDLWLKKTGRTQEDGMNQAMLMGKVLEPVVAQVFAIQHMGEMGEFQGYKLTASQNTHALTGEFDFASCTPDYYLESPDGEVQIFEVKTTSEYGRKDWEAALPDHAHVQVIWQMGILSIKKAKVACLIGGRDLVTWDVLFDAELFEQLLSHAVSFWEMVKQNLPPETESAALVSLKEFDEEEIELPAMQALMQQYLDTKKEKSEHDAEGKKMDAKVKALKAKIMLEMGRYGKVTAGGFYAIKKEINRDGYSVKASKYTDLTVKCVSGEV